MSKRQSMEYRNLELERAYWQYNILENDDAEDSYY